jgi:eukaryotic-like serine/threonine-protein kinase
MPGSGCLSEWNQEMPTKAQDDEVVMDLVDLALTRPAAERKAYIEEACASDSELRDKVWNYVEWDARMNGFLLEPLYSIRAMEHPFKKGDLLHQRFRILEEVGEGGMAIVYKATDERVDQLVAVKCAKPGFGNRLPPEVRHARRINHTNVCRIYEIHTASTPFGEIDFIAMEFLEGETLAKRLARGPLPEAEALTIARQLCAGLGEAHSNQVIHGDLKSNNVILATGAKGAIRAVITDFGLAKDVEALRASEHLGVSGGTLPYMAPELWTGAKVSVASDIYALGVVLHELVYGKTPGSSAASVAHKPKWDRILKRCLDPKPLSRFGDAEKIAKALEPSRVLRSWLAAAAAVALVAATGAFTYERATAPKESLSIALLPLSGAADTSALAANVSRDVEAELKHLKGGKRAKLKIIPMADVARRHVDSAEKAGTVLGASHVVQGTVAQENGRVVLHAQVTDTHSRANTGEREFRYAPGEVHYAPKAIAGMVTATLGLPPLPVAPVNAAASNDYEQGVRDIRQNSTLDAALRTLQRAVEEDRDSPQTHAALAEADWFKYYFTKDQLWADRARESVQTAESRGPDTAPAHRVEGYLYYKAGLYGRAQAEFGRAIQLQPGNAMSHIYLGKAYEDNNQLAQALTEFQAATQVEPNYFRTYQNLGAYYNNRSNLVEAARSVRKAFDLAPKEPEVGWQLAAACMELGQFPQAERLLRESLKRQETLNLAYSLGRILMYENREREAVGFFQRALELMNQSSSPGGVWRPLTLVYLGISYRRLGLMTEADEANRNGLKFAKAERARNYVDGYVNAFLAYFEAALGTREGAEEEIDRALSLSRDNADIRWRAVLTYEELYRRFHDKALREGTFRVLKDAKGTELADLNRWPDLADLQQDSRFIDSVKSHPVEDGGNVCAQ